MINEGGSEKTWYGIIIVYERVNLLVHQIRVGQHVTMCWFQALCGQGQTALDRVLAEHHALDLVTGGEHSLESKRGVWSLWSRCVT